MNLESRLVEHAPFGAILGKTIERGQRIRRYRRTQPLDHIAVVVVMRRLDQHEAELVGQSGHWGSKRSKFAYTLAHFPVRGPLNCPLENAEMQEFIAGAAFRTWSTCSNLDPTCIVPPSRLMKPRRRRSPSKSNGKRYHISEVERSLCATASSTDRQQLRVIRYRFGAHRKRLNVGFAPKATSCCVAANGRNGPIAVMRPPPLTCNQSRQSSPLELR